MTVPPLIAVPLIAVPLVDPPAALPPAPGRDRRPADRALGGAGGRDRRVDVVVLAVAAVWGSSFLVAKRLVEADGVLPVLSLRFAVAALALVAVCGLVRARTGAGCVGRAELRIGGLLGLTQAGVLGLETWGVSLTSATNAGLLIALVVVLTPLLEGAAARRWLPRPFFVAAAVSLVGIALLVGGGGVRGPSAGDALVIAAAAVRAVHVTALGHLTRAAAGGCAADGTAARRPVSTVGITAVQAVVCALLFTAADPGGALAAAAGAGASRWLGYAHLGLACTVFAFLAQLWAVRRTSATRASLLMGTEPVWAVVIGVGLGGELLGPAGALGALLVVVGTTWGGRVEVRHRGAGAGVSPGTS